MDLAASYGPKELADTNRSRAWSGIHSLDPNSKLPYDAERFPLLNSLSEGSEKIDIRDALNMFRNRFERFAHKSGICASNLYNRKCKIKIQNKAAVRQWLL